jgi:hypothetical protein
MHSPSGTIGPPRWSVTFADTVPASGYAPVPSGESLVTVLTVHVSPFPVASEVALGSTVRSVNAMPGIGAENVTVPANETVPVTSEAGAADGSRDPPASSTATMIALMMPSRLDTRDASRKASTRKR